MASNTPAVLFQAKAESARYNANIVSAVDLEPVEGPILTGIGFLDHMLDQFNSHAQIGLSVVISDFATAAAAKHDNKNDDHNVVDSDAVDMHQNRNRHAHHDQGKLLSLVGAKVGAEFHRLLVNRGRHFDNDKNASGSSRFVCPLDESLVACILTPVATGHGQLVSYTLPPYGKFPSMTGGGGGGGGRTKLGHLQTIYLETFWSSLAAHAHLDLCFEKLSGDNGHHIVEASFKAMARGLRNLLDGTNTTTTTIASSSSTLFPAAAAPSTPLDHVHQQQQQQMAAALEALYGPNSENYRQSIALNRQASICRKTKETNIQVALNMNGGAGGGGGTDDEAGSMIQQQQQQSVVVDTGITVLDQFLVDLFFATQYMSATIQCQDGDLHIDEHHSVEDVAITLGQVLHETLGTKAGLNRMWCATVEKQSSNGKNGNCKVEVVLDLSNRPMLCCHDLAFMQELAQGQQQPEEMVGDLPIELIPHFLESFIVQGHLTCHIRQIHNHENSTTTTTNGEEASSTQDLLCCIATALGTALRYCCMVDSRRAGATASSKGTLSA